MSDPVIAPIAAPKKLKISKPKKTDAPADAPAVDAPAVPAVPAVDAPVAPVAPALKHKNNTKTLDLVITSLVEAFSLDVVKVKSVLKDIVPSNSEYFGKKKRSKKNPKAPLKDKSPYICYSLAVRPKFAAENKDAKFVDITHLVSESWRALADKSKYVEESAADRRRYEAEMVIWNARDPSQDHLLSDRRPKKAKAPKAPKADAVVA